MLKAHGTFRIHVFLGLQGISSELLARWGISDLQLQCMESYRFRQDYCERLYLMVLCLHMFAMGPCVVWG